METCTLCGETDADPENGWGWPVCDDCFHIESAVLPQFPQFPHVKWPMVAKVASVTMLALALGLQADLIWTVV